MSKPASVTYTGHEVAHLVGVIAKALPSAGRDFDLYDLMLEKALAGLSGPLDAEVWAAIDGLREEGRRAA
jgi:hypothetical protein